MAVEYVLHEGQICRKVESFEPVDLAQLNSAVEAAQVTVNARMSELESLQSQLDAKSIELEDAESVLEDCKRNVDAATALVDEPNDDEATDGTSGEADNSATEPII